MLLEWTLKQPDKWQMQLSGWIQYTRYYRHLQLRPHAWTSFQFHCITTELTCLVSTGSCYNFLTAFLTKSHEFWDSSSPFLIPTSHVCLCKNNRWVEQLETKVEKPKERLIILYKKELLLLKDNKNIYIFTKDFDASSWSRLGLNALSNSNTTAVQEEIKILRSYASQPCLVILRQLNSCGNKPGIWANLDWRTKDHKCPGFKITQKLCE